MPITLEGTVAGNIIAATAEARGRAEERVVERTRTMTTLLRRSFGDDARIDDLAHAVRSADRDE